ncbi:MAG TPA: hypothetical protein VF463_15575 [Sphingobium sp.]
MAAWGFYLSKHEFIFVFKKGGVPHINTFELSQHGRYRTNVWDYAGVNSMRAGRDAELACIRPLSRSPWLPMRSSIAPGVAGSCLMFFRAGHDNFGG